MSTAQVAFRSSEVIRTRAFADLCTEANQRRATRTHNTHLGLIFFLTMERDDLGIYTLVQHVFGTKGRGAGLV